MFPRVHLLTRLVCLLVFAAALMANNLLVLPDGVTSQTVQALTANPVSAAGTYESGPGTVIAVIPAPNGQKFYTISNTANGAVVVTDANFVVLSRSGAWSDPATAAAISPDGRRLLVTAGPLRIIDTTSDQVISTPLTGSLALDVAVDNSSSYALVLSATPKRLYKVNLNSNTVVATLDVQGEPTGVSASPNGLFYVSSRNEILVVDGETMTVVANIILNGQPMKIYFSPDGSYGVATNDLLPTGVSVWVFDLTANSIARSLPVLQAGGGPVKFRPRVHVINNERALLTSNVSPVIYDIELNGSGVTTMLVKGIGSPTNVKAIATSGEVPAAKFLYYLTDKDVLRVDLSNNQLSGTPYNLPAPGQSLEYAAPASMATPADAIMYNNLQSIPDGGAFKPIILKVTDANGLPVFGAAVTFQSLAGVTFENASETTNKDGLAQALVIPGEVVGQIPVTVTVGGVLTRRFDLNVGAGGGGGITGGLAIVSGNGQLVNREFGFVKPFVVRLTNADGNPIADSTVSWSLVEGEGGLVTGQSTTDADGLAQNFFIVTPLRTSRSYVTNIVRAASGENSIDFVITSFPTVDFANRPLPKPNDTVRKPSFANRALEGKVGEILKEAIDVIIVAGSGINQGDGIPNVAIELQNAKSPDEGPTATCAGGGVVLSDEKGVATCDVVLGGKVGTSTFNIVVGGQYNTHGPILLTVTKGDAAIIQKLTGDNQEGKQGTLLPRQLSIIVTDAAGNPLAGQPVLWEVTPAGAATLSNAGAITNALGRASASVTLGNTPGPLTVRVSSGLAAASFSLKTAVNITGFSKFSGDNQSALVGQQFPQALVVEVRDELGGGVANQDVFFQVASGDAALGSASVKTDQSGRASVLVTAGATAGPIVVSASYGTFAPLNFSLFARFPGPAISASSFTNGASGMPGVVPGSVVTITGEGLAPTLQGCQTPLSMFGALPYELAGVSVQFGPDSAPLNAPMFHVCNVNGVQSVAVQAPFGLTPGLWPATVRVQGGSTRVENVQVFAVQPGIFETTGANGLRYGVAVRPDGSYVTPDNPAKRGEIICLFATGLGAVNPPIGTNVRGLSNQQVVAEVIVGVNHAGTRLERAEYAPGVIGLYTVYFEIPADTATGPAQPLALAAKGAGDAQFIFGNGSTIAIQP